jgi:uncharacterized protein (DUF1778 family)
MAAKRTAILLRCSEEEAQDIRQAAQQEKRTISGFILNAVHNRLEARKRLRERFEQIGDPEAPPRV